MTITPKYAESNESVIFQATDELADAIRSRAEDSGLTVSDYLRSIISNAVGVHEIVSPLCALLVNAVFRDARDCAQGSANACAAIPSTSPCTDPIALLPAAGSGDTQSQRDLADAAIALALSGQPDVDPFVTLSEGLVFARLADRHGDIDDAMRIIRMLALASMLAAGSAARHLAAEAIARLELLACGTSEEADRVADQLASELGAEHPDTMRLAQDYRDRLSDGGPDFGSMRDAS